VAGKKSLADNGTLNQSRIKLLAEMFLSNESRALEILDQLGADYVLIFLGVMRIEQGNIVNYQFTGYGEDTKFIQMARIAGIPTDMFINDMETRINMSAPYFKDAFWDTFLGKLIPYEYITTQVAQGRQPIDLYRYVPKYPEKPDGSSKLVLVFRSGDEFWYQDKNVLYYKPGEVLIYKVVRDGSS
jgi:dolichyl-diphosphooligosaccharide--protein glycosyltransferase